jgi:signal peptidase II
LPPKLRIALATALPLVALDVATKEWVVRALQPLVPHPVLGDVLRLTLAYNRHGAMGLTLGSWSRALFGTLALLALGVLGVMLKRTMPADRLRAGAIGLLAAGAAGNLWDRLRGSQGVVDFIDVGVGRFRFWTFNVADAALTVGVLVLAYVLWREDVGRARAGANGAARQSNTEPTD